MELKELREKLKGTGIWIVLKKQYYGRLALISIDGISLESAIPVDNYNAIKDKIQLLTDTIGEERIVFKGEEVTGFKDYRRAYVPGAKTFKKRG